VEAEITSESGVPGGGGGGSVWSLPSPPPPQEERVNTIAAATNTFQYFIVLSFFIGLIVPYMSQLKKFPKRYHLRVKRGLNTV
jgi:hypothetical protein